MNERFLGITHVNNTAVVTLKSAIEEVFNKHSLALVDCGDKATTGQATCEVS